MRVAWYPWVTAGPGTWGVVTLKHVAHVWQAQRSRPTQQRSPRRGYRSE